MEQIERGTDGPRLIVAVCAQIRSERMMIAQIDQGTIRCAPPWPIFAFQPLNRARPGSASKRARGDRPLRDGRRDGADRRACGSGNREGQRCLGPPPLAARCSGTGKAGQGRRRGGEARSAIAGRAFHLWPDGAQGALHCRGARRRRRSIHAAHLCRARRERAQLDRRAHRAALARKKASGALLGNRTNLAEACAMGNAANRKAADAFAANVLPIVRQIQAAGITAAWRRQGAERSRHPTARGGEWHSSAVRNLLARA